MGKKHKRVEEKESEEDEKEEKAKGVCERRE